jgi:uncharacterized protein (DUF427 family)
MAAFPRIESVWAYPRPPIVVPDEREVIVIVRDITVASTTRAVRVLETSHPPTFYIPFVDVDVSLLRESSMRTHCEFKGIATYWDVVVDRCVSADAGWGYPEPNRGYEALRDTIAFYPGRVDQCTVDGENVSPQPGGFYGGWITSEIEGPFKGSPGTALW